MNYIGLENSVVSEDHPQSVVAASYLDPPVTQMHYFDHLGK